MAATANVMKYRRSGIRFIISYSVFSILLQIALLLNIIFIEQILHNTRLQMNQEIALGAARNKIDAIHHQEENDQKLREVRHDIRNHLNSISCLISDGHIKEAQKYIQQLMGMTLLLKKRSIQGISSSTD